MDVTDEKYAWTDRFLDGKPDGQLVWAGIGWKARTSTMKLLVTRKTYDAHVGKYLALKGLDPEIYLGLLKLHEEAKKLVARADALNQTRREIEGQLQNDMAYWLHYHEEHPDEQGITVIFIEQTQS